jgi:hypothetical protein
MSGDADEKQVAEFSRHTRKRRIYFAVTAFGVASLALVGGLFLFGGQLQTAEKARAGQAADALRRRLDAYRPRCPGLWRDVLVIDWPRVPEVQSRVLAARLSGEGLLCPDVVALARSLPRREGVKLPPRRAPASGPAPAAGGAVPGAPASRPAP